MNIKKAVVIGLGHFGSNLSMKLHELGVEVVGIDIDEAKVEAVKKHVTVPLVMDSTSERDLKQLDLQDFDVVVVAIGEDFKASLLTVGHIIELNPKHLIARIISPVHERILRSMGVQDLLLPEKNSAVFLADKLTMLGGVNEALSLSEDYKIFEVAIPSHMVGKTVNEISFKEEYQLVPLTVKKSQGLLTKGIMGRIFSRNILGLIPDDYRFEKDDIILLFGNKSEIKKLER